MMPRNFLRMLRYDLVNGYRSNKIKLIIAAVLFFIPCLMLIGEIKTYQETDGMVYSIGILDFAAYTFRGSLPYEKNTGATFQIPVVWFTLQFFVMYMVSVYPTKDLGGFGKDVIFYSRSRCKWWCSKYLWSLQMVIAYYGLGIAVMAGASIIYNKGLLVWSGTSAHFVIPIVGMGNASLAELEIKALVGVLITSLSMATVTLLISVMLSTIYAVLINTILLVVTSFVRSNFLPYEYSIILRDGGIDPLGHDVRHGILMSLVLIVTTFLLGVYYIRKIDLVCWRKD